MSAYAAASVSAKTRGSNSLWSIGSVWPDTTRTTVQDNLGYFAIGLDITVPTQTELFGRPLIIGITPAYYYYFRRIRYAELDDPDNSIGEEFELAISVLTRRPFSILGIEVDRIGIAVSSGEGITGYRLFTSLPF